MMELAGKNGWLLLPLSCDSKEVSNTDVILPWHHMDNTDGLLAGSCHQYAIIIKAFTIHASNEQSLCNTCQKMHTCSCMIAANNFLLDTCVLIIYLHMFVCTANSPRR